MKPNRTRRVDSVDRDILRYLYSDPSKPASANRIARRINLSPPAIKPRLVNLRRQGIIKPIHTQGMRTFERKFPVKGGKPVTKTINAPRSVLWGLDMQPTDMTKVRSAIQKIRKRGY